MPGSPSDPTDPAPEYIQRRRSRASRLRGYDASPDYGGPPDTWATYVFYGVVLVGWIVAGAALLRR